MGGKKTTEEWIIEAKKVHGDKYGYQNVDYKGAHKKITIICFTHGEFEQRPSGHLVGYGCKKCAVDCQKSTTEEFIQKAKKVHGDKYYYQNVNYKNNRDKITIICFTHGEFKQSPKGHLEGKGCSKCLLCPKCQLWRTFGKLCLYCKPNNKLYKNAYKKSKELAIVKFLREELPDRDFNHNKSVGSHCTKDEKENSNGHLFPDIRFDCVFYHLIVEVDEHKHRGADYTCDKQRMYDIIAKLGLPCIFIRYNPDSKESNKKLLLKKVKKYLELDIKDGKVWDEFGFKADYMFY